MTLKDFGDIVNTGGPGVGLVIVLFFIWKAGLVKVPVQSDELTAINTKLDTIVEKMHSIEMDLRVLETVVKRG